METEVLFLEPTSAGLVLGLSASRIRALADEGELRVAARTTRGLRLFRPEDVAKLKARRQKAQEEDR